MRRILPRALDGINPFLLLMSLNLMHPAPIAKAFEPAFQRYVAKPVNHSVAVR